MLSGTGTTPTEGQIKWADDYVWNNDGDTAFLLNPVGETVDMTRCL